MIPIPLRWLTVAASLLAAVLGGVMLYLGVGLGLVLWAEPRDATATLGAIEGTLIGFANLASCFWIWRARLGAVLLGGVANAALVIHVVVVHNFFGGVPLFNDARVGALFWGHAVLLALLILVGFRLADMRRDA